MASAASADLPTLGVGIIYNPAIEPLLLQEPDLVDVIEIEPQTLWTNSSGQAAKGLSEEVLSHLSALPCHKLVHSVGTPAGGTVRPELAELEKLNYWATRLGSPWWSDHLSFNRTPEFSTGFFLPPNQTLESVETLAAGIRQLKTGIAKPLALETGVNYLRPRDGELPDGEFVARTVAAADCGILLDLHNVFTNERNGRQSVEDYLSQLPLDRVWEMHLAGGMWHEGYWLDAHSGPMPDELFSLAAQVVPRLPNLKAIMFEIFPTFVPVVGFDAIATDIARLRTLWDTRNPKAKPQSRSAFWTTQTSKPSIPAHQWESMLGGAVIGMTGLSTEESQIGLDPAVKLVQGLIHEFRASMISRTMPLTVRLLMLMLGPEVLRSLIRDFERKQTPQLYALREAKAFAAYLTNLNLQVPRLSEIIAFEQAVVLTLEDNVTRIVPFKFEPLPFLREIAAGLLPQQSPRAGKYEIEVTGDTERRSDLSTIRPTSGSS